jgi:hypothetical protein
LATQYSYRPLYSDTGVYDTLVSEYVQWVEEEPWPTR